MNELSKLFGSTARLKLLRLFMFNPDEPLEVKDIARRTKIHRETVRSEIVKLKNICFLKKKTFYKELKQKEPTSRKKKRKVTGWIFDPRFVYTEQLREFLIETAPLEDREVLYKLRGTGTLKLVVVAGVFNKEFNSRVDLLIVGDRLHKRDLETAIRSIEAEIGKELRCAILSSHDFRYRMSVYDKLVRDVLDYPHRIILDRFGTQQIRSSLLP